MWPTLLLVREPARVCAVVAYTVMADVVMANTFMAYIFMAYIDVACTVIANRFGLHCSWLHACVQLWSI